MVRSSIVVVSGSTDEYVAQELSFIKLLNSSGLEDGHLAELEAARY